LPRDVHRRELRSVGLLDAIRRSPESEGQPWAVRGLQ
jgi:hypothetical protein